MAGLAEQLSGTNCPLCTLGTATLHLGDSHAKPLCSAPSAEPAQDPSLPGLQPAPLLSRGSAASSPFIQGQIGDSVHRRPQIQAPLSLLQPRDLLSPPEPRQLESSPCKTPSAGPGDAFPGGSRGTGRVQVTERGQDPCRERGCHAQRHAQQQGRGPAARFAAGGGFALQTAPAPRYFFAARTILSLINNSQVQTITLAVMGWEPHVPGEGEGAGAVAIVNACCTGWGGRRVG